MNAFAAEIENQLIDAHIEDLKESSAARSSVLATLKSGDADVDGALAGPMELTSTDADKHVIFDTQTGEPRPVLISQLSKTMRKKRNGKAAFSMQPTVEYRLGNVLCYLHPDHPDYASLAAVGLHGKVCGGGETNPAAHLASEYDRELHMQHRHSREWAVIKESRERLEREEERRLRREEIEAMKMMAAAAQGGSRQKAG